MLQGYPVIVIVIELGTSRPEDLEADMVYYFVVVWSDGTHLIRNTSLGEVTNLNILPFRNVFETLGTIGECWRSLESLWNRNCLQR